MIKYSKLLNRRLSGNLILRLGKLEAIYLAHTLENRKQYNAIMVMEITVLERVMLTFDFRIT